ncbi:MAG TPA: multicopper oxidase domain-containing protein [Rubrobacteraceae bacterium]|nr:multicopper oxidase domain-containing protein [Rubrobacteraceae bacterium]
MELTRGEMLKLSLLGSAALMLPLERVARTRLKSADRLPKSRLPEPFKVPFAVPPVLAPVCTDGGTDYYEIKMMAARLPMLPGLPPTEIWGYNGITPGPTIQVMQGRKTVIRQMNLLPDRHPVLGYESTTSVHLHGSGSLPQYDGYANDTTSTGFFKDYHYPNNQNARTLWYHDHGVHHTDENAYMGLAAQYHLHDQNEIGLPIPHGYWEESNPARPTGGGRPGKYDVPLVIKDAIFATDGSLIFDDQGHSSLMGDVVLTNGRPWPVMKVERRKYRFRILNASVSRGYDLALSSGDPMTVIGHDGGLAPAPVDVGHFRVGMAERYEVVIDFAKYSVGQKVVLENRGLPNNADFKSTRNIMRFDVVGEATDPSGNDVPEVLNPGGFSHDPMKLQESQAVDVHKLRLQRKNGQWTIDGKIWDPNRVDHRCHLDEIDIWELTNKSGGWFHPLHIHLIDFRILDRNGRPPFPWERGPKDVAYIGEGETVRVLGQFGPNEGKYMVHCHNLTHEDHDMMTQFEVGAGGFDPIESARPKPISEAAPLCGTV